VTSFRDGIVGRGLLLDVAHDRGIDCLPDNEAISPDELDKVAAAQGVEVRAGDIVLVRTGRVGRAVREGSYPFESFIMASPGLSVRCASWLVQHDVAAVAMDNVAVERPTSEIEGTLMPLHMICQRDAGIVFGELFDLEALSAACAQDRRWEFMLVAAPIPITGAVGGPVNPLAIL
jgi:kynurenine formamidase